MNSEQNVQECLQDPVDDATKDEQCSCRRKQNILTSTEGQTSEKPE